MIYNLIVCSKNPKTIYTFKTYNLLKGKNLPPIVYYFLLAVEFFFVESL